MEQRKSVLQDRVLDALLHPGGATLDHTGKPFTGTGYIVADPYLTAEEVTTTGQVVTWLLSRSVQQALQQERFIGKWTNPETGLAEINISDVFLTEKFARLIGKERKQISIGFIRDGEYQGDILL